MTDGSRTRPRLVIVHAELRGCSRAELETLANALLAASGGFLEITVARKRRAVSCQDLADWLGLIATRSPSAGGSSPTDSLQVK